MTASGLNSLAALLAEYQGSQAAAGAPQVAGPGPVDPLVAMSDPLASLDASTKGALSPGNVSLLKPWGQHCDGTVLHMPEVGSLLSKSCLAGMFFVAVSECGATL